MRGRTVRTQERRKKFLQALDGGQGNVSDACEAAGLSRRSAYDWREADEAFREEWDAVVDKHMDTLENEVYRRAYEGVDKGVYYQGELVQTEKVYSDTLAMFILKGHRPNKYRDNSKVELGGIGGGPLKIEVEFIDEAPVEPESA